MYVYLVIKSILEVLKMCALLLIVMTTIKARGEIHRHINSQTVCAAEDITFDNFQKQRIITH